MKNGILIVAVLELLASLVGNGLLILNKASQSRAIVTWQQQNAECQRELAGVAN